MWFSCSIFKNLLHTVIRFTVMPFALYRHDKMKRGECRFDITIAALTSIILGEDFNFRTHVFKHSRDKALKRFWSAVFPQFLYQFIRNFIHQIEFDSFSRRIYFFF